MKSASVGVGFWSGAVLCAASFGGLVAIDAAEGTLRAQATPATVALLVVAFAGFGLVAWGLERGSVRTAWLWGLPIVFRLLLIVFTTPTLSDDVYRYLWDGHLVSQGVNPYAFAISAAEGDAYDIGARALANNPDMASPYLPTTQGVFAAAAVTLPSEPVVMQVIMTAFDLLAAVLIARLLALADLPGHRVAWYLWNPLIIVEFAHGAHLDALMVMLTLLAVWLTLRRDGADVRAPIVLALATLTRPIPLLVAPILWWRWTWPERVTYAATTVLLVVPFGLGPGFGLFGDLDGTGVFGAARIYSSEFRFNAVVSTWIEGWSGAAFDALLVVTMAAVVGWSWWAARHASLRATLGLLVVPLVGYVTLTPVLHPWYLALVVAVVPLALAPHPSWRTWLAVAPLAWLVAMVPVSYLTYENPAAFGERDWVRRLEWWPAIALALAAVAMCAAHRANYRGGDGTTPARSPALPREEP